MKKFNILCLTAALSIGLLTSCSSDISTPDEPSQPESATFTISLVTKDGAANSRGVSTSDPEEDLGEEGKIYNVAILLSRKSLTATDLSSSDKIDYVFYKKITDTQGEGSISHDTAPTVTVTINKVLIGVYYAIALVNFYESEDKAKDAWEGQPLINLRTLSYSGAPFENVGNDNLQTYYKFRMTSDEEKAIDFSSTTSDNTIITVERLTSRVDLKIEGMELTPTGSVDNGDYTVSACKVPVYKCNSNGQPIDENGTVLTDPPYVLTNTTMDITGIYLQNINKKSTYYIQRSSNSAKGTPVYFADEGFDGTNYATAYVQTPSTYYKSETEPTANIIENLGNYGWLLTKDENDDTQKDAVLFDKLFSTNHIITGNKKGFYTLTYIGEFTNYDYSYNTTNGLTGTYPYLEFTYTYTSPDLNIVDASRKFSMPFLHCKPGVGFNYSQPMAIAIIRNTIYRFNLVFFTDNDYIYVRWYYYSDLNSANGTTYSTKISKIISESGENPTVID